MSSKWDKYSKSQPAPSKGLHSNWAYNFSASRMLLLKRYLTFWMHIHVFSHCNSGLEMARCCSCLLWNSLHVHYNVPSESHQQCDLCSVLFCSGVCVVTTMWLVFNEYQSLAPWAYQGTLNNCLRCMLDSIHLIFVLLHPFLATFPVQCSLCLIFSTCGIFCSKEYHTLVSFRYLSVQNNQ